MKARQTRGSFAAPKRILVPCDFSEPSRAALGYAAALARTFNASVILLHVVEPVQPGFLIEGVVSRQTQGLIRERAGQELHRLAKQLASGVCADRPLVKAGKPWEVIESIASRTAADLIVMGTHGYTGLKHAALGSVAERVVRHAPCPVLTVRAKSNR
jgi:nucleotide-binding universal stress UspA family protein